MVRGRRGRRNARWPWPVLGGAGVVSVVIVAVVGIGQVTGGRTCASTVPAAGTVAGTATHYALSGTGNREPAGFGSGGNRAGQLA
jgi:hypothetical protein